MLLNLPAGAPGWWWATQDTLLFVSPEGETVLLTGAILLLVSIDTVPDDTPHTAVPLLCGTIVESERTSVICKAPCLLETRVPCSLVVEPHASGL